MNKVSKIATRIAASAVTGVAGIAAAAALTTSGDTVSAERGCPDDMHWVVCPTVEEVTDTVTGITDGITDGITADMHW